MLIGGGFRAIQGTEKADIYPNSDNVLYEMVDFHEKGL